MSIAQIVVVSSLGKDGYEMQNIQTALCRIICLLLSNPKKIRENGLAENTTKIQLPGLRLEFQAMRCFKPDLSTSNSFGMSCLYSTFDNLKFSQTLHRRPSSWFLKLQSSTFGNKSTNSKRQTCRQFSRLLASFVQLQA